MSSNNNNQEQNAQQGSGTTTTTSSNTNVAIIDANSTGTDGDLNASIGSNRSLNNRIFPSFRISRDIILNNVSHSRLLNKQNYMKTILCRYFKKFDLSFKIQVLQMHPLRHG